MNDSPMRSEEDAPYEVPIERPWIVWKNTFEVEAWIDQLNRDLQHTIKKTNAVGYGICFCLGEGGEIYMHTDQEGSILLDVTPEAEWVAPLITAATRVPAPSGQIWALPGTAMTQLVLGLSPLIASTRLILSHDYRIRKY